MSSFHVRPGEAVSEDWKRAVTIVYDGGCRYWTVRYDVETDRCLGLLVNGKG